MEDPLQKSEEFYKVFRYSPYPLCVIDMDTHCYLDVNEALERQSGYRRDEVVGRTTDEIWRAFTPDYGPHILEEVRRRVREEGSLHNLEVRVHKKSGEIRTVLCSAERIMLKGKVWAVVDVTDRRQAEQALQEAKNRTDGCLR